MCTILKTFSLAEALDAVTRKRESSVQSSSPAPVDFSRTRSYSDRPPGSYITSPIPYTYRPNYSNFDRNRLGSVQSFTSDTTEYSDTSRNNNSIDETRQIDQPNLIATQSATTRVRRGSRKSWVVKMKSF